MVSKIGLCVLAGGLALGIFYGCSDLGVDPPALPVTPTIVRVQPDSASVGDTVTIVGAHFGVLQSSSTVSIGGTVANMVFLWSDSTIRVIIPSGSATGTVVIIVGGSVSNEHTFALRSAAPIVSFSSNILPIFLRNGCLSCHGGLGGLEVGTVAQLLRGGDHGPVIVPGNAAASHIIQKLSPNPPFGERMPLGGSLPDSTVQVIRNWINQGAHNN